MNYVALKREFIQSLITSGRTDLSEVPPFVASEVPTKIMERWIKKFYNTKRPEGLPERPRLINHFSIGADPEFVFIHPGHGLIHAENVGLKAGLCIGADNNGRLVELRPQPSRSALEVVASLLEELRWTGFMVTEDAAVSNWKAGAWSGNDGLGGHIHFGRKRDTKREDEIKALDAISAALFKSGFFDANEQHKRHNGPGHYGGYSETRSQNHGYEYRTLPSWLVSPWVTFICLVLAKLAVFNPSIVINMFRGIFDRDRMPTAEVRAKILNLLSFYKALDDDALYASIGLSIWGLPFMEKVKVDFKPAWGINTTQRLTKGIPPMPFAMPSLLPQFIAPSREVVLEVFNHICYGRPLEMQYPKIPAWPNTYVNTNFRSAQVSMLTRVAPGLGEMFWDLVVPKEIKFAIMSEAIDKPVITIGDTLGQVVDLHAIVAHLQDKRLGVRIEIANGHSMLVVSRGALGRQYAKATRELLLCGALPLLRASDTEKFEFSAWRQRWNVGSKKQRAKNPSSVKLYEA